MSKAKQAKNFYAIFYRDSKKCFIVKTWPECQRIMCGHSNYMRGFSTEAEAKIWLSSLSASKPNDKVTYQIKLKHSDNVQFQKRLFELKMSPAELIENLILEYLYDLG